MAENPELIDQSCPVRPCVIDKGLENCAQCKQYICAKLTERLVVYEEVQQRVGAEIPKQDYLLFIRAVCIMPSTESGEKAGNLSEW
jgi:hypothetical protein